MKLKRGHLVFGVVCILFFGSAARSQREAVNEAKDDIVPVPVDYEIRHTESIPEMNIEFRDGAVTGAVLVHDGKGYPLSEEEYHLLLNGEEPEIVLAERNEGKL